MSQNMVANVQIGIIGAGAMGSAIAAGLVASGCAEPSQIFICDHNADKLAALASSSHVVTCATSEEVLTSDVNVVVLAIKPQVLSQFIQDNTAQLSGKLVVSIAAGVSLHALEADLSGARVVRVMPNLPVAVRSGASAICAGTSATQEDIALVQQMFSALGSAVVMREDQLDVAGAVAGCGPAYFALMVDALTRAGVLRGLSAAATREMVVATMKGVACMLESGEVHPREYMERVTSPGGTTAAALYELEPALCDGVYAAVDAALARTQELAGE